MDKRVRVRFAPSPTGGLHLGGMRTVLYNYLFAKKHAGDFVLRIEDTDQSRYVAGAEEYIFNCLKWAGLEPTESPVNGGNYGPYRQSERKELYRKYAEQLVKDGHAYYAFDTPEDLEKMRQDFKTEQNPSPQYDGSIRMKMRNSVSLSADETGIKFSNVIDETKLPGDALNEFAYMGGGVGVIDVNKDGLQDLFFTGNQVSCRAYINKGKNSFEDITEKAGVGGNMDWSTGVTMADINGDGLLDIYVCNSGDVKGNNRKNELFINNGNLTFSEKAKEYNLDNEGYSTHAAFFDYDQDGDLDCYILNNSFRDPGKIELYKNCI